MCCSRCSVELWVVQLDGPHTDWDELAYRALFVVASGEEPGHISACELGQTSLNAKHPIDWTTAAALHPELVRRAEAEWAKLDDADSPDNAASDTGGGGAAVLDELDRHDPALDITEVDALLIAEAGEA